MISCVSRPPANMICHYTEKTAGNVSSVRIPHVGQNYTISDVRFDVKEILAMSEYVELETAGETILSWGRDRDKTKGVLNRMYCGARMIAEDISLAERETLVSITFGFILEPYLSYPKWNTFCLRITDKVEELIVYYGVYINLDVDYFVSIPGAETEGM